MHRGTFFKLSGLIGDKVGDCEFKSEKSTRAPKQTYKATAFKGGEITGELCMGIFLWLLAGASYLDLFMFYGVSPSSVFASFKKVTKWINEMFKFPLVQALQDEDTQFFEEISRNFSKDSYGQYKGCIGALDGLALWIRCPTVSELLRDPGSYFTQKGYYALNLQAICDVNKHILWLSSCHIGSCHDS